MSSPPASAPSNDDPPSTNEEAVTTDAEMADATTVQDSTASQPQSQTGPANDRSSTIDNDATNPDADANADVETDPNQPSLQLHSSLPPPASRKDVTLRDFLSKMDDYAPIIPDAVTAHYLTLAGLPPPSPNDPTGARTGATPLPLARLLALATQKFIADVAGDAYQYSRIRAGNTAAAGNPVLPGGAPAAPEVGKAGGAAGKREAAQLGVQRAGFGGGGTGGSAGGKTVLTMEDLGMAVQEYGVNVRRGEFYR